MKAQCCICSDLFDQDGSAISAVACGHTFHEVCLMRWLDTSSTCPHCRKRINRNHIVRKLFFDQAEDYDQTKDNPEKLINEVDQLKLDLKKKDKRLQDLEDNNMQLNQRIEVIQQEKKSIEKKYKKEQTSNSCLHKQLMFYESQQKALDSEREEYKTVKKKLVDMKEIESLLDGCDSEVSDILQQYGEGEGSLRQLATYCAVLKREYEKTKNEKKICREEIEKRRKELWAKDRDLNVKTKEVKSLSEQLKHSENDLKFSEIDKANLKKKLERLKKGIEFPGSSLSSSILEACTEENVMPTTPVSLQKPQGDNKFIDLSGDFDADHMPVNCVLTPEIVRPSPTTQMKRHCEENSVQFVKISSASDHKQPAKRIKSDSGISDVSNLAAMGYNIFRKKTGPDYSSTVRKGFNGLGGYTTFAQPSGVGKFAPKTKTSSKPRNNIKPLGNLSSKKAMPALPTLDNFLDKR